MTPIDARGLERASAYLFSRTARLVGWGSGSVFDYFHGQTGMAPNDLELHPVTGIRFS